jgi:hypothetical protein
MSTASDQPAPTATRRTVATYSTYREAERAVDYLSDEGFPVEHVAIVGTGLRLVEQVAGRVTTGRAAGIGALQGVLIGLLFALFFGIFFTGPGFGWLLLYAVIAGALFGALFGAISQASQGGRRDFASATSTQADKYEIHVDVAVADEARRLLDSLPAR